MRTITLVTQKGGAGKTTLATAIGVAAHEAGEKVVLLDLDPQGSLTSWGEGRKEDFPTFAALNASMIPRLPELLSNLEAQDFSLVILDTAGIDAAGAHQAMQVADLNLIPARPTTMDIRATKATHDALVRLGAPFSFILNQCPPQPNNPRAAEAASGLRMWGILAEPLILQRAAHQDAFAVGQGVTEYEPTGKAANEIRQLWQWINNKMEGAPHGKAGKLINWD